MSQAARSMMLWASSESEAMLAQQTKLALSKMKHTSLK